MPQYQVHFLTTMSVTVRVDADNPESAIDAAYDEAPGGICTQCSGWGQPWSRDADGDLEPDAVTDKTGAKVWSRNGAVR